MKKVFVVVSLLFVTGVFAQVKIANQPGESYYESVREWGAGKTPAKKDLLAMKAAPVNFNIDTLKKYDWLAVGSYFYNDKDYADYFAPGLFTNEKEDQYQFRSFRVLGDGTKAEFSLNKFKTDPSNITTTSFDKNTSSIYKSVKVVKGISYLESVFYGESAWLKIVSYKNGVLIIDINKSGKITDPGVNFRQVYYAIPKKFDWDFGK